MALQFAVCHVYDLKRDPLRHTSKLTQLKTYYLDTNSFIMEILFGKNGLRRTTNSILNQKFPNTFIPTILKSYNISLSLSIRDVVFLQ